MTNELRDADVMEMVGVSQDIPSPKVDVTEIPGAQSMTIRPEDVGSWVAAWELKVDRDGQEYGVPVKLPRGQLPHYVSKKREVDGGRRFTLQMPARLAPIPQYVCPVGSCTKRVDMRTKLLGHIQNYHAQEAVYYAPFLKELQDAIIRDNPKMAALFADIAGTPETGLVSVPTLLQGEGVESPEEEEIIDVSGMGGARPHGRPQVGPVIYHCRVPDCTRFFDSPKAEKMHQVVAHKKEK